MTFGENLTLEQIEALLDEEKPATPPETQTASTGPTPAAQPATPAAQPQAATQSEALKGQEGAKAFAARLNAAREAEREAVAKAAGFGSYADLLKSKESSILKTKGIDPDIAAPAIDEIVAKRLAEHPDIQELKRLREQQEIEFGRRQLGELSAITGGKVSRFDQLSPQVVELWKQKGDLKGAYMFYHGAEYISGAAVSAMSSQSKGSVAHLASPVGVPPAAAADGTRPPTEQELAVYRKFNPQATPEQIARLRYKC